MFVVFFTVINRHRVYTFFYLVLFCNSFHHEKAMEISFVNTAFQVLHSGWSPVIFSMLISSGGGFVLENSVNAYKNIAIFQPVINGRVVISLFFH